jgi:DNA-binding GntR family transcriptional regulator
MIDGLAARLAAECADAAARASVSALIERQEMALDPWDAGDYTRTNVAFHTRIMEVAGNEYVLAEVPVVRMTSQVFTPVAFLAFESARTAVDQHREIASAIEVGDGDAAEDLARRHIRTTIDRMARHESQKAEAHG